MNSVTAVELGNGRAKFSAMPPKRTGSPDDFQTPPEAARVLLPYLEDIDLIWEPACGKGNIVRALAAEDRVVIGTDIKYGADFFTTAPPPRTDIIITNPPYTLKTQWIERCHELGLPWALLLPLTALESQRRQSVFKACGLELILLDRRINFETPSGEGTGAWFPVAWFTSGLNIGQQLTFATVEVPAKRTEGGLFSEVAA